jgi:hypothetical protein
MAIGKYEDKYSVNCAFTPAQYMAWRDRHLLGGTEFLCELHGGEISQSPDAVFSIIDALDKERFQLQTNGLGAPEFYDGLIARKSKIDRIGFTFHRTEIDRIAGGRKTFERNVKLIRNSGIPVYVKELLILEHKAAILEHKKFWEARCVEFSIQDFKGYRGRNGDEQDRYAADDWAIVHEEYKHGGAQCHCRDGYKQVLIRGYDIFAGDIVACWNDPCVVGNIIEGW